MKISATLLERLVRQLGGRSAIITGGAHGIGAQTVRLLRACQVKVVFADLASARNSAEQLIQSLDPEHRSHLKFVPADVTNWTDMQNLFRVTRDTFGGPDLVVANAGIMESKNVLDLDDIDENGELSPPREAYRVIDINLKGTLNTLKTAMFYMSSNSKPCIQAPGSEENTIALLPQATTVVESKDEIKSWPQNTSPRSPVPDRSRLSAPLFGSGSITLVSSTSGYFGGSAVAAYVASKHGVIGLMRASQRAAGAINVRVNSIAPFFTPTNITSSYASDWAKAGLKANTTDDVALAIVCQLADTTQHGSCVLVAGGETTEIEHRRTTLLEDWLGSANTRLMGEAEKLFSRLGGYPLPTPVRTDVD